MESAFQSLPPEILSHVALRTRPLDLLSLALVNHACSVAATDEATWEVLTAQHLKPMVGALFDGQLPMPRGSWKRHFFMLRSSWKRLAQERTGRLLVQVGEQSLTGRGPEDLVSLFDVVWDRPRPRTYGIYDVTSFIDSHPGADLILREAAEEIDATETFEMNGHSDQAVRMLRTLVVKGLEALPYDHELDDECTKRRLSRLSLLRRCWHDLKHSVTLWLLVIGLASWSSGNGRFFVVLAVSLAIILAYAVCIEVYLVSRRASVSLWHKLTSPRAGGDSADCASSSSTPAWRRRRSVFAIRT